MTLPSVLRVLSHEFEVLAAPGISGLDAVACVSHDACRVMVDTDRPESCQREGLLHEVLEELDYRLELKLKHRQITALSEGLADTLLRNPEVAALFAGDED